MFRKILCYIKRNPKCVFGAYYRASVYEAHVKLHSGAFLSHCTVGSYTYIGDRASVSHADVGRFCSIGQDVIVGAGTHPTNFISTSPIFYSSGRQLPESWLDVSKFHEYSERTIIGHDVWIGSRVICLRGINIGVGAIIGAGAVVTRDVKPYEIVAGVPAKHIRYRFDAETRKTLLVSQWWNWPVARIKKDLNNFSREDFKIEDVY